jgi:hypothetical protein
MRPAGCEAPVSRDQPASFGMLILNRASAFRNYGRVRLMTIQGDVMGVGAGGQDALNATTRERHAEKTLARSGGASRALHCSLVSKILGTCDNCTADPTVKVRQFSLRATLHYSPFLNLALKSTTPSRDRNRISTLVSAH